MNMSQAWKTFSGNYERDCVISLMTYNHWRYKLKGFAVGTIEREICDFISRIDITNDILKQNLVISFHITSPVDNMYIPILHTHIEYKGLSVAFATSSLDYVGNDGAHINFRHILNDSIVHVRNKLDDMYNDDITNNYVKNPGFEVTYEIVDDLHYNNPVNDIPTPVSDRLGIDWSSYM